MGGGQVVNMFWIKRSPPLEYGPTIPQDNAMGFSRFTSGATVVIVDAEAPASGPTSFNAHASTGAFELSTGRNPLIVSCGSGLKLWT